MTQLLGEFRRRLFGRDCILDKLFDSSAALNQSSAIGAGLEVFEHILIRLDQQLVVEIRIEIPPVRFTGSSVELNQVHKLTTWTFSVLLFKGHGTAGLFPKTKIFRPEMRKSGLGSAVRSCKIGANPR